MILWKDKKLAEKLHANKVSAIQQFFYLLIFCLPLLSFSQLFQSHKTISTYESVTEYLCIPSFLATLVYSFFINKKGDGKDFISRFICLSTPIMVKAFLFAIILSLPATFLDNISTLSSLKPNMTDAEMDAWSGKIAFGPISSICFLGVLLYSARRYAVSFRIASGQSK